MVAVFSISFAQQDSKAARCVCACTAVHDGRVASLSACVAVFCGRLFVDPSVTQDSGVLCFIRSSTSKLDRCRVTAPLPEILKILKCLVVFSLPTLADHGRIVFFSFLFVLQDAFDGLLKLTTAKGYSLGDIVQVGAKRPCLLVEHASKTILSLSLFCSSFFGPGVRVECKTQNKLRRHFFKRGLHL